MAFSIVRTAMKKSLSYFTVTLGAFFLITSSSLPAFAQLPFSASGHDTTRANVYMDSVVVTAEFPGEPLEKEFQISRQHSLDRLFSGSELNTSVSGLSQDLQLDMPSMIRLYTPQGIPFLTKYTSNNSLTSTIPDSAVDFNMREPSARYPNPDAPVILQPNYRQKRSLEASPLNQTLGISSGTDQRMAGTMSVSHSNAPKVLQQRIPELQAYSTTHTGYGAVSANFSNWETEVVFHHSRSENEYGGLLGVEHLEENYESTNFFANTQYTLKGISVHAGMAHQLGNEYRQVQDVIRGYEKNHEVINEIDVTTLTSAIGIGTRTELRTNYHDMSRVYTGGSQDTVDTQRLETVFSHQQKLFSVLRLSAEGRYDHRDQEPSFSSELLVHAGPKWLFTLDGGRLYDAVGSEGINSLMNSVQTEPHPWITRYGRLGINFQPKQTRINASLMHKEIERGWYGKSSVIDGWVLRAGAKGSVGRQTNNRYLISWNIYGVMRDINLDMPDQPVQAMPGPAKLEGHASLEADVGNMHYAIQSDAFIDRKMRITQKVLGDLGSQYFLSFHLTRTIGVAKVGIRLDNALALAGKENRITAHVNEEGEVDFVHAPPIPNIHVGVNLLNN